MYKVTVSMSTTTQVLLLQPYIFNLSSIDNNVCISESFPVVPHYMVHHQLPWQLMTYTEITEIERWQILSSLVHSSLIAHWSYSLKLLMLKVIRRIALLPSSWLDHCSIMCAWHDDRLSLWIPRCFQLPIRSICRIVVIAAHSWDNIPWEFPCRLQECLAG